MDTARRSTTDRQPTKCTTVVDPRMSLAIWLRTGRGERGLSLEDVARTTKIQLKTLERIESGNHDGLPADVFVRGFVRSIARCVGLDEDEALKRYTQCAEPIGAQPVAVPVAARAVVEAMAELAPVAAEAISEPALASESLAESLAEPAPESAAEQPKPSSKKRKRGAKRARRRSARMATGTPVEPTPVVEAAAEEIPAEPIPEPEPPPVVETVQPVDEIPVRTLEPTEPFELLEPSEPWQPTMPPLPTTATVPWRLARPASRIASAKVPSLVIDDADPEGAERVREDRAQGGDGDAPRRSFLPPILLDRDDRSIRQGGLTLAVILLLIAATLTLSYLMRRPSSSGEGVTQADSHGSLIG